MIDIRDIQPGDTVEAIGYTCLVTSVDLDDNRVWGHWSDELPSARPLFINPKYITKHTPKVFHYDPKQQPEDDSI